MTQARGAARRPGWRSLDLSAAAAAVPVPVPAVEPDGFTVDADGTRIHFLDWGPGRVGPERSGPGVLLIHGLAQTAWAWAPVARRLAAHTRVVAMDLRGHGLSDAPTGDQSLGLLAEDAIAVVEGTLLDEAGVVLAGHGFGAIVAAWAAGALEAEGRGMLRGLVLVDGGWEDLAEATGMDADEWLRGLDEPPEVLRSMSAFLADRRDFDPASWDADQERAARATVVEVPAGHLVPAIRPHALAAAVRTMFAYRPDLVLPLLDTPVVALAADDPDGARTERLAEMARRRHAGGRSAIAIAAFPGVGHNLMRYRPADVAAAILEVGATIAR